MKSLRLVLIMIAGVSIAACSGGSSSGAGWLAGTYTGSLTITVTSSANPGVAFTRTDTVFIVVNPGGSVTSDQATIGSVNGSTIVFNVDVSQLNDPSLSCIGSIRFEGTITASTINGTISSSANLSCNGIPMTFTGTFSFNRVSRAQARASGTFMGSVLQAFRKQLPSNR